MDTNPTRCHTRLHPQAGDFFGDSWENLSSSDSVRMDHRIGLCLHALWRIPPKVSAQIPDTPLHDFFTFQYYGLVSKPR